MTAAKGAGVPTPAGVGKEKAEQRVDLKGEQVRQKEKLSFSERKELGFRRVDCRVRVTVRPSCLGRWEHRSDLRKWSERVGGARVQGEEGSCKQCVSSLPWKEGGSAQELCSLPLHLSGSAASTRVTLRAVTPVEEESAGPGARRTVVVLTS